MSVAFPVPQLPSPSAVAALGAVRTALGKALDVDWFAIDKSELAALGQAVEELNRKISALNGEVFGAIYSRDAWQDTGAKDFRRFIHETTGGSSQRVTAEIHLAEASDPNDGIPAATSALRNGEISAEHVTTIAKMSNTPQLKQQLRDPIAGAQYLVDLAKQQPVGQFGTAVHTWRNTHAPATADVDAKAAHQSQTCSLRPDPRNPGMMILSWRMTTVNGTLADQVLTAAMGRRPSEDDRSPDTRRAGAMTEIFRGAAANDSDGRRGVTTNMIVMVPVDTFKAHIRAAGSGFLPSSVFETHNDVSTNRTTCPGTRSRRRHRHVRGDSPGYRDPRIDPVKCGEVTSGRGGDHNASNGSCGDDNASVDSVGDARDRADDSIDISARFIPSRNVPPLRLPSGETLAAPGGPRVPLPDPSLLNSSDPVVVARARQEVQDGLKVLRSLRPGDPHVISAAIAHEKLQGLSPPLLGDGTPIAPWEFALLACNAKFNRHIFSSRSIVLDVGRSRRYFSDEQKKAILARDRNCQWPGCHAPPKYLEFHHSLWWFLHQGATNVELGIAVCFAHHDDIHRDEVSIVRFDGAWYFYTREGELMTEESHGHNPGHILEQGPPEDWLRPSKVNNRLENAPDFLPKPGDDERSEWTAAPDEKREPGTPGF